MKVVLFLMLSGISCWAQPKFEVVEISGTFKSIDPYWNFAHERMTVVTTDGDRTFGFDPKHGGFINQHLKVGDEVHIKVKMNLSRKNYEGKVNSAALLYWFRDTVVGIKVNGVWHELKEEPSQKLSMRVELSLDKVVRQEVVVDGLKRGFVFDNGLIGYGYYQGFLKALNQDISVGDVVSFIGYENEMPEGYTYPVENVKKVVLFSRLYKDKGKIKSLLFKQNNVCIGLVFSTGTRQIRLSFPSNYAERIKEFADRDQPVVAYFDELEEHLSKDSDLNPPELHALIQGRDTIKITEFGFWGGADIKHEHTPTSVKGKITQVNKLNSGVIYSIVLDNETYVDIDHATQKQLGKFFKKGMAMEVTGKERIKAQGEIYRPDYRIITPDKIIIDGTVFQLNQLP